MTNDELLKKLFKLQEFKTRNEELKTFIADWIHDTQLDIAKESMSYVGLGSNYKVFSKWLKDNRKHLPCMQGVVQLSKHENIIGTQYYAVCSPGTMKFPQMYRQDSIDQAKVLLHAINEDQINCTEKMFVPMRSELDAIIRTHKATPVKKRQSKRPLYRFEPKDGLDIWVDAEYLMDMLAVFPTTVCWYDPKRKSASHLYFSYGNYRGILCPVKVDDRAKRG